MTSNYIDFPIHHRRGDAEERPAHARATLPYVGAAVEDPHVGRMVGVRGVHVSADDVDLGAHGGVSGPHWLFLDGDQWDWSEFEEILLYWVGVSVDGIPAVVAVVVRSYFEVVGGLDAVEE